MENTSSNKREQLIKRLQNNQLKGSQNKVDIKSVFEKARQQLKEGKLFNSAPSATVKPALPNTKTIPAIFQECREKLASMTDEE